MHHHEAHLRFIKRGLVSLLLLLSCSSAEARLVLNPLRTNITKFRHHAQAQSVTNLPVNTWAPICEVLKDKKVEGYSTKQWHIKGVLSDVFCGSLFFLILLVITYSSTSKRMAFLAWILYAIICGLLFFPEFWLPLLISIVAAPGIILAKDCPRVGKVLAGICLTTLGVSFLATKFITPNRFAYVDDYSFPEYLVSSTSPNIVVVHEKMDLPYKKIHRSMKEILYRDGRIDSVSTNELATLLQAQAEEIRMFKQGASLKNPE